MKLGFHPKAETELIEAAAYCELQVPGLGARFAAEVRRATHVPLERPEIGAPADSMLCKSSLTRLPFALHYSLKRDLLRIEVVAHQRRQPGY